MARPLRIELPDGYYHVMNRGNNRQDIFLSDQDRKVFLEALADSCEIFDVHMMAYVLMTNHFHLLVHTARANLSEFMRHFQVSYTVRFNRRNRRSGHVFQGRYKSLLVEADEYLLPLSRYIHLNPVRMKRFENAEFRKKAVHLKKYPWSSFAGYCYLRKRKQGFDYSRLLNSYFGGDDSQGRRQYREYVLKGIDAEIENPFEDVLHQSILGTQEFVKWVKEKLPRKESREVPASRSLQRNLTVDQVVGAVSEFCSVEPAEILNRNIQAKRVRQMTMELCYRYCNLGQRQIGKIFKVDYSTVSANRSRLNSRLKSDRRLEKDFKQIQERIINLNN
jgi:REP element-mobilizing transposase RayT